MGAFSSIDIANTGVGFSKYWLDTIAHNLANMNTVRAGDEEPFRARMVVAQQLGGQLASTGSGVAVRAIVEQGGDAARVYEPDNPLADEEGYIVRPLVDLTAQMTDLIIAQRSYAANLRVMETGRDAYQAALRLGQAQ